MTTLLEPRLRRQVDKLLLFAVGLLMLFSLVAIYYATLANPRMNTLMTVARQGVYFTIGLGLMTYVASRDYRAVVRFTPFLYWGNLALLFFVKFAGHEAKGAARWIRIPLPFIDLKLQPSEFAKICIILTLAAYVASLGPKIREFPVLLKTLVHVGVPMLLIAAQPDLGTSLVFLAIWGGVVFLAGARPQHLVALGVAGIALFGAAWYGNVLRPYQKSRVHTFINPLSDPKGKGYHVLQSQTAIGGGQVLGQGVGKGKQTNGVFIPENHTDFIFTVVGEETGFVGACVLLSTYGLLLWRGLVTIGECEDQLGRLIAGGVVTLFAFHLTVNVGMTCGIMPVVGVPLPLMSFGGSAVWANLTAIGLLLGIHMRRHKILF